MVNSSVYCRDCLWNAAASETLERELNGVSSCSNCDEVIEQGQSAYCYTCSQECDECSDERMSAYCEYHIPESDCDMPHGCNNCGDDYYVLCSSCAKSDSDFRTDRCDDCSAPSVVSRLCSKCDEKYIPRPDDVPIVGKAIVNTDSNNIEIDDIVVNWN